MGILNKIKNAFAWDNSPGEEQWELLSTSDPKGWDFYKNTNEMSEITYYICMKVLSESVGKLSIHLKNDKNEKITDHEAIRLLRIRPNKYMSPTDFKSVMEYKRNHIGNSYAFIETNKKGERTGLYPLDPRKMKVVVDNDNSFNSEKYIYEYKLSDSKSRYFHPEEIVHLKGGLSADGIVGRSVAEELGSTIKGSRESQRYLNNLYERGLTANAVLQYTGDLSEAKKKELVRTITQFAKSEESGNIVPLPLGMELTPLDIKLTDAQFIEIKNFTSLQIAAAFGVKPNHLNNYEKSSYANSEMQNLTFYIDTLLYILTKWEQELTYKLLHESERKEGLHFKFNVGSILRGDLSTQAEALNKYTHGSIYTINEARDYLDMPKIDGGDIAIVNGSYLKLEDIGKAYRKNEEKEVGEKDKT